MHSISHLEDQPAYRPSVPNVHLYPERVKKTSNLKITTIFQGTLILSVTDIN
jgi:hypothetical protein